MNRRTVLGLAGASISAGLAGCLDGVQEHFGFQGVIPLEIHNETDQPHNISLRARERETGRDSYEEDINVGPQESVWPPNLDESEQSFIVRRHEGDESATVRELSLSPDTSLVIVRIHEDDLVVEVEYGDDQEEIIDGNETDADENRTADGDE